MQENEFEKQIKRIMEDFHISPSASVWDKVSRKLDKKRRPKLLPFLLLLIGLAGAGYFIFYSAESNVQNSKTITGNKDIKGTIKADSIIVKKPVNPVTEKIEQADEPSLSLKNINGNKSPDLNDNPKLLSPVTLQPSRILPSERNDIVEQQSDSNSNVHQTNVQGVQKNDSSLLYNDTTANKNTVADKELKETGNMDAVRANNDSPVVVNPDSMAVVANKQQNQPANSIKKSPRQNYKLPNWQWGITALYGGSNAIESLVDLNKAASADYIAPGNAPGNNDTVFYNSQPYTPSNAYHIGAVLQKKIIKNGFIATGLNFTHLSTKADVSEKIDDRYIVQSANNLNNAFTVDEYYKAGSSTTYTNRYNFIELPVYFQQDIRPSKKFSFSYNAGFSVRQLISSKSLIYNQYSGIYFYKDDLLRKTQFQLLAGLNLKINTGSKMSVYIGPQFSYSLSNFLKNEENGNFHFINYGLQAGLMFHKK